MRKRGSMKEREEENKNEREMDRRKQGGRR